MADPVISAAPAPADTIRSRARFLDFEIPEVWKRFLFALLGLVLAFAAALFSTVARESGSLWTTVILASIALTLAVVVGLTTVPYLARRVAGGRVRDAFNYDVTGVGIIYVVTVLLIGVAALNTGNNLLYVIVAAMLAAILVSGVASAIVLRDLELDVRLPEQVFAGRPTLGKIVIRNRRRWLPSFSISVVPLKQKPSAKWQSVPTTFGFPPGRPADQQWVRLPDRQFRRVTDGAATPPGIFTESAYFPYIPAAAELTAELELCFPRRGRYQQNSFGLATRFPFAFLTKTRRVALAREILVYPPVEATDEFFEVIPLITGEFESFARGRGDDLYLIREYMPEDSARHVDWKATAKSGIAESARVQPRGRTQAAHRFRQSWSGNRFRAGLRKCGDGGGIIRLALRGSECRTIFRSAGLSGRGGDLRLPRISGNGGSASCVVGAGRPGNFRRLQHHSHHSSARNDSRQSLGLLVLYFYRDAELTRRLPKLYMQPRDR